MKSFSALIAFPFLKLKQTTDAFAARHPRWMCLLLCALLGLISLATYSNSFRGGMVLDNAIILQMDQRLQPKKTFKPAPNPAKPGEVLQVPVALDSRNILQWYSSPARKTDSAAAEIAAEKGKPEKETYGMWAGFVKEPYREQIARMFTENYWWPSFPTDLYRPLTTLSYFFNYTVLGSKTDLFSYHVVNWLLHWVNACLALLICRALFPGRYAIAFLAAAIFALHPVAVESVTNIVGRADLLSTLSILLAGYIYIHMAAQIDRVPASKGQSVRRWVHWALLAVPFVGVSLLGVLTKESAVMLLGFVLLYDFFFRFFKLPMPAQTRFKPGRFWLVAVVDSVLIFIAIWMARWMWNFEPSITLKIVWIGFIAVLALTALAFLFFNLEGPGLRHQAVLETLKTAFFRYGLLGVALVVPSILLVFYGKLIILSSSPFYGQIFIDNPIVGADCFDGLMTAVKVLGLYLGLLVFPGDLSCDYSFNQIPVFGDHTARFWDNAQAWISLFIVVLLLVSALRFVKKSPAFGFGVFWFFVMILTTSNVFFPIGSIMAERFLYLPLLGFAIVAAVAVRALARALDRAVEKETGSGGVCLVLVPSLVLSLLGVRSYVRNFDWRDDVALWRSAVETCPRSFKVHKGYAGALRIESQPYFPLPETVDQLDFLEFSMLNSARDRKGAALLTPGAKLTPEESDRVGRWRNQPQRGEKNAPSETEIYFINAERAKNGRKPYAEDPVLDDTDKKVRDLWGAVVAERGLDKALARVEEGIRVLDSGDLPDNKQDNTLFYDSGLYYNTKAKVLEDRGDVQEALRYYQRAYEILWRGVRVDMHVNQASKEAMRARGIPEAEIIDVGNPKIRTQFIVAALRLGRTQEAYESALVNRRMVPLDPEADYILGVVLREMGHPDKARALFIEALLLRHDYLQAWKELSEAYAKLPDAKNAIVEGPGGAPALNVDNPVVRGDLKAAFVDLEALLWDTKRYDEAKDIRQASVINYKQDPSIFPLRDSTLRTGRVARSGRAIEQTAGEE